MKKWIREFKEKDTIQDVFLVNEKTSGKDRNGKAFLSLTLSDSSGQINARMFERVEAYADGFDVGDAVKIKGFVQLFQGRKQMVLHELRRAVEGEFQMSDLVAELGGDSRAHLERLIELAESLENQQIRRLLLETLADAEVQARLLKAPAAKTIHHAYRGGLIEHIRSIAEVMNLLAGHYSFLDRDLLIFGAIFHDIGKIWELDLSSGIHYTSSGRLVGHMALACELIDAKTAVIEGFSAELKDILKHIVLSHHGKLEFGSPKLPMIAEAMVVAMIDDLDSKMNTLFQFLKGEVESVTPEEKWSHFSPGFERYFYLDFFRERLKRLK